MAHPDLRRKRHNPYTYRGHAMTNPRISRKGFMNPSSTYHPCHLCGELEHTHEMRVNIQNGAALCARCVLETLRPGGVPLKRNAHKYFSLKRQAEMERRFIPHLKRSKCQLKTQ